MEKRGAGVLLNVSSMPSEYGIGGFSRDIDYFLSVMRDMGFSYWQVLPLTTIGEGNSPYSGVSVYALNYLYIDPNDLLDRGLVSAEDIERIKYKGEPYLADYDNAKIIKKDILWTAYSNIDKKIKEELDIFFLDNLNWLQDYCIFMRLKEIYDNKPWCEWEDDFKRYSNINKDKFLKENYSLCYYYVFEQYILFKQWKRIRNVAHSIDMCIIGDLPIYVSLDSVDVWANTHYFQLDKELKPIKVAGVPPDYFAAEGQLWGNPLYDFKIMKKDGYKWWIDRFSRIFSLFDGVRIDHFRGFGQYWAVDRDAENAIKGEWEDGPGMELFKLIKEKFSNNLIIAEDLGMIDDKTREFLKKTGFPGMRVMQFAFTDQESTHLPHNYPINCVAYTATHDNDTTLGWLYNQKEHIREYALSYCGYDGFGWGAGGGDCKSTKAFIKTLMASSAILIVLPLQDMCGYGSDTRMNVPGVAENNWLYRATYSAFSSIDRDFMLKNNNLYGRNNGYIRKC